LSYAPTVGSATGGQFVIVAFPAHTVMANTRGRDQNDALKERVIWRRAFRAHFPGALFRHTF